MITLDILPKEQAIAKGLNPQEAKLYFGATHYITTANGVTPQLYYKFEDIPINDGTVRRALVYLSYCQFWNGSSVQNPVEFLKEHAVEIP